jgi:hypothetical protein
MKYWTMFISTLLGLWYHYETSAVAHLKLAAPGLPLMATDVVAEGTQFKFINFDRNKQACNHYIQHT